MRIVPKCERILDFYKRKVCIIIYNAEEGKNEKKAALAHTHSR